MKIKTSELAGAALGWAVSLITNSDWEHDDRLGNVQCLDDDSYDPQDNWAQGGPIIEREMITIDYDHYGPTLLWEAKHFAFDGTVLQREYGPTPLIAAMRCYVASEMGDEVDVPEELK
jgi:hypothetical protein